MVFIKIAFISDLHIDKNRRSEPDEYLDLTAKLIKNNKIDLFIIGGDISDSYSMTFDFVEQLQHKTRIPVYFVPGNHDYWQKGIEEKDTWGVHKRYIEHSQSLVNSPLDINRQVGVVGNCAWYNHAYYNKDRFSPEEIERGRYKGAVWRDRTYLDWKMSDQEVSKIFAEQIQKDIELINKNQIILVTHIVTVPELVVPMPHKAFDYFNAFIGTDDLDEIIRAYPVTHNFMGHVHYRHEIEKDNVKYILNCLGYGREWPDKDIYGQLESAMYILEI